jgi:hypothetical protein
MSLVRGIYDKIMSIITTNTVVNPGEYTPVSTDIVPVYDYATASDANPGEKIAVKKYVRITDIGTGTPDTYNLASPANTPVGGVTPGYVLTGQTWQQIIEKLLVVYQSPVISAFSINSQSGTVEVGDIITSPKTFTITYNNPANVLANSFEISNNFVQATIYGPAAVPASGVATAPITFTPVQLLTNGSVTWTAKIKNTQNADVTRNTTVNWRFRIYVGGNSNTTLTESQIEALNVNNQLTDTSVRTYTFPNYSTSPNYLYFCFPHAVSGFTYPTTWLSGGLSFGMIENTAPYTNQDSAGRWYALVNITNSYGVANQYRVYRSSQLLSGSNLSVVIS